MNPSTIKKSVVRILGPAGEVLGTGFVALAGGYIVTCWHVVEGMEDLAIQTEDDPRQLVATLRPDLSDADADIAVLHVPDGANLVPVRLGRAWSAQHGAWSYGFQYQSYVTSGYPVTGKISGDTVVDSRRFVVVTDIDVQRGLSGAPLLNMNTGRVVAMIHAKLGSKGVGLAIPVETITARWTALRRALAQPPDYLRGRVSDLFSAMGYRVLAEPEAATGSTPSLVAELPVGPVRLRALVVVPGSDDLEDPAETQRAVQIVGSLLTQRKFDKGFVITTGRPAIPTRAIAAAQQVELLTVIDLEQSLIDFTHYLEAVVHDFENFGSFFRGGHYPVIDYFRWCDLYRYYVDLRCVDLLTGRARPSSTAALKDFLSAAGQHLLSVLGDYGTGKTSLCLQLTYELAHQCLRDPAGTRIPVFIPLRNLDHRLGVRRLILDTLTDYGVRVADYKAFELMSRAGRFVLLLDGFDEVADGLDRREVRQVFGQISQLATGHAKIVLTCRTHYFRSEHQSLETLTTEAMTPLMREVREHHGFGIMELQKFDERQILELMSRRYAKDYHRRWQYIRAVYNLADLARTPILLNIMLSSFGDLISLASDTAINSAKLYDMYTKFWLERDDERSDVTALERLRFAQSLAWRMYTTDRLSIPYDELSAAVGEFFADPHPRDTQWLAKLDTNVRTCSFLARDRFGNFMFAHKSFMEFFVAKRLAGSVGDWPTSDLGSRIFSYEISDFLKQLVSPDDVTLIKAQALDRQNSDVLRGLCMDVLIGLGDTMREEPLVFALVSTLDGLLVTANADGTATVLTPELGIVTSLAGHDNWIRQVAVSPNGKLLATCGWDSRVMLWQLPDFVKCGEALLSERVNSVCFDRRSELLLCAGYDRAISVLDTGTMRIAFTLVGHTNGVNAIIAAPTEDLVVSAGLDKTLRVWSLRPPGELIVAIQQEEPTTRLAFAADGRFFASGSWTGEVTVWGAAGPQVQWANRNHTNMIGALGFSPDSRYLASSSDDRTAKIWSAAEGELVASLPGTDFVTAVCFGRCGQRFYCGGYDSHVHMYEMATWTLLRSTNLKVRG